jgi:hypothetical protein
MHATLIDLIFSRKLATALMTTRRGRLTAAGVDLSRHGMHASYISTKRREDN